MWPVSALWEPACRQSRPAVVTASVWSQGVPLGVDLRVEGGSVRVDESSKVRRAGSLVVADTDRIPWDADGLLSPVTCDLLIQVGHRYADGGTETVPAGMLRVMTPSMASLDGPLTLEVADFFAVLNSTRWPVPRVTAAGIRVVAEITAMVTSVLPWVEVIDLTGSQTVTRSQSWSGSVGEAVTELATAIGAEAFFDALGRLVLRASPDGTAASVWTLDTDTPSAVVEDASLTVDVSRVWNAVYVESSDPSLPAPASAVAFQSEGSLRWRPGFQRVRRFASPLLQTREACEAAARTLLAKSAAYAATVEPSSAPNWALDVGDTVTLAIGGAPTGTRVLSKLTFGLGATDMRMSVATRLGVEGVEVASGMSELS